MAKYTKEEVEQAKETLRRYYPKGSTVYTILRKVSSSGMSRQISVKAITATDQGLRIVSPNFSAHVVLGYQINRSGNDSLVVKGCGMDMGFEVAYNLGLALYDDGDALNHEWL